MSEGLNPELVNLMNTGFREVREKIDAEADRASQSRKAVYAKLDEQGRSMQDLQHRMGSVESKWDDAKPTLDEFQTIKTKVRVAGLLGRFLWWFCGVLLAFAATLYAYRDKVAAIWQQVIR